ncbi:hypothetical protein LOZ53_004460 [Ophidiomyces ophidiicola]|nr:hypothetical protein LOZ55_006139 [Ophidiomyces ophidiicola]KAI1984066.1 hypothetical protein LOZ51_006751 [Ophidiomyces ophidiicola]KAI1985355.1 hypothetical protein LOZ54_004225 [Ophidiomyces ophidiicola]KAI1987130.1 hypothetical protein LOZ53_004460 [Ophidiomyces ophidiicola]
MDSPKLYVVFYRPRYGNYQHWALYLDADDQDVIFEVNFVGKVFVAVISKNDIPRVHDIVNITPVDNETVEWDCQEYVLDILDKLEDDFILEEEDEEYREPREELKEKRGAIH